MNKDSPVQHPLIARTGVRLSIVAIIIIVAVAACRSIWVSLYGVDIPFWDQWAQVMTQLAPLKQGTLHYSEYWSPHNEHRVLFTRLISMALFEMNGGIWSNLVEAYVNTVIYGATLALFYVLACRNANRLFCLILLFAVIILAAMPYDWENILVGFQNQFYIMIAFAIALAGVASYRRPGWTTFSLLVVLATASLFTMASGLFGAAIVCTVIVFRAWREPLPKTFAASVVLAMMLVMLCGLLLLPSAPGNDVYKAHGIFDHARAVATALVWPLVPMKPKYFLFGLLIWAPSVLWLIKFLRTKAASDREIFLMGLIAWVVLQAVAIAHARGHNISSIPPRYSNIASIGLLANLALALILASNWRPNTLVKYLGYASIVLGVGITSVIFVKRTPRDIDDMQQRYDFGRMETFYTRSYLISRDPAFLQHAPLAIPFPDAALLKAFLDSPIVDSLLPPTLQQASADPATDMTHKGKSVAQIALDAQKAAQHFMARIGVSSPPIFFQEVTGDSDVGTENSPIGSCSNTNVNDTEITTGPLLAKSGDPLRFYGWIINPQSHITNRFFLVLSGNKRYKLEVDPFLERKDVVRAMHSNHRDTYGFRASGILLNVAPGTYAVRLTTPADHGQVICTLPYQLVVAP